jgi:porin
MNLTFCGSQPGNLVGDYWYNWPVSQWAGRIKANLAEFGYAQLGGYEINPNWLTRRYAFYFGSPPGATGALVPAEIGWLPSFGPDQLSGSYKFGAWYNTSKTADVVKNTQGGLLALGGGAPLQHDGAYGGYVNFQQKLTKAPPDRPDQGISVFFNATFADRRTATLANQIAFGIFDTGPFDTRPTDQLGIAFGRTHVNDRVAAAEEAQNAAAVAPVAVQHSEYVWEIYYKLHASPGIYIQPNIQFIHKPGGIVKNKDVVISGLKFSVRL